MDKKLNYEEFVKKAITSLRLDGYKGIHSVHSGFNRVFREYFMEDPIETTKKLEADGKIVIQPVKGGVMLYLPEEAPRKRAASGDIFKKMGL